jgi:hypothetical protein
MRSIGSVGAVYQPLDERHHLLDNSVCVRQQLGTRESHDCVPLALQVMLTRLVMLELCVVDFAVDFDNEASGVAIEIDNVRADWELSAKVVAEGLLVAHTLPEGEFGRGHAMAQGACCLGSSHGVMLQVNGPHRHAARATSPRGGG